MGMLDIVSGGLWSDAAAAPAGGSTGMGTTVTTTGTSDIPTQNLFMSRGEFEFFDIPLSAIDPDTGATRDLSTYSDLIFTAKRSLADADAAAVFSKRKGAGFGTAGILRVDPDGTGARNTFRVWANPADTQSLDVGYPSHLRWDARAILATGNVREEMEGWLDVGVGATQAIV